MKTNIILVFIIFIFFGCKTPEYTFQSEWHSKENRIWVGEDYWANPLEDWQLNKGQLECLKSHGKRSVHLITHELVKGGELLEIDLKLDGENNNKGKAGIELGLKNKHRNEYRFNAIWGKGLEIGVDRKENKLYCLDQINQKVLAEQDISLNPEAAIELKICAVRNEGSDYTVEVVMNTKNAAQENIMIENISDTNLTGNIALFSRGQHTFKSWQISGDKLKYFPDRSWGPILWSQYSLSRNVLTVSAQLAPALIPEQEATFEVKFGDIWKPISAVIPDTLSRTAIFRISDWDDTKDHLFRIGYVLDGATYFWNGTIRKDPKDSAEISVAGFTGHKDYNFPNLSIVENVRRHNPDMLFFSGDQIYEQNGGYPVVRKPLEKAVLSYLGKYYLFGWSFGDLMRDRPSVVIPDDHDVFVGNIWGNNGKGFVMPGMFVNAVQKTQTGNLPEAYNARPIGKGINTYYTDMLYGRISFAILEDRKFKSAPTDIPKEIRGTMGRPDHVSSSSFDPAKVNDSAYKLLGNKQLEFLEDWASNWKGADFKVALSQTTFAGVATHHGAGSQFLIADYDANGWPQHARNKALKKLRKGFAFMFAGDTHLPTIVKHGIDQWSDAGWAFCVPSIAAGYPRSWLPSVPGGNHKEGMPAYTGDYLDGFGNKISVWAVANPKTVIAHRDAAALAGDTDMIVKKRSGYGIMTFNRTTGDATMECYDINSGPGDTQMLGWPLRVNMLENDGRKAIEMLPKLSIEGLKRPVVQIINEADNEVIYTLRLIQSIFSPKVYEPGNYTIRIGDPDINKWKTLEGIKSKKNSDDLLEVKFE